MRFQECSSLVCFALKEEADAFQKIAKEDSARRILLTGIGKKNAEKQLRVFLASHLPSHVFTCGFAGGLNPSLNLGTVVFATEDISLREKLLATHAVPAKIFCASRIAITRAEKELLRVETGADAVEMESGTIHVICREHGIPCATVRVISDSASEDLPLDFNQLSKSDLSIDYSKLAGAIIRSPKKILSLCQLQKKCRFASEQLANVLAQLTFP
ncbi:MAG: hypothetical protein ABI042_06075 [Verrucomicrobiota bacterium]